MVFTLVMVFVFYLQTFQNQICNLVQLLPCKWLDELRRQFMQEHFETSTCNAHSSINFHMLSGESKWDSRLQNLNFSILSCASIFFNVLSLWTIRLYYIHLTLKQFWASQKNYKRPIYFLKVQRASWYNKKFCEKKS